MPKLKRLVAVLPGEARVGMSILGQQSLNLPAVIGTIEKIDPVVVDQWDRSWQLVLVKYADGGAWHSLCSSGGCEVFHRGAA